MAQQYSLAHLTVLGCAPPEMTYIAARAGYEFVSIRAIYMGLPGEPNYALAENPEMLRQTKAALKSTGVRVHDIELARIHDEVDVKRYLPALEVAAELGARAVLSSVWTPNHEYALEQFALLCDLARPLKLTVDLEPVPITPVRTVADAAKMLRTVRRDNAGLVVDAHHFHRALDTPPVLDAIPREWFHFAQICDARPEIPTDRAEMIRIMREERLYLGEGGIEVAAIFERLPEMVYSIELPHLARVKEIGYAEHAFRCLESAKAYFAAHAVSDRARRVSRPARRH
jgi:sugar phosphate isomerase/epimerase